MAELGSSNVNGDLRTTGDHTVGENSAVEGNSDTKGVLTEKGQRVFSPNNRNISNAVNSASASVYASSLAAKTAYDKGVQALNTANGKLGAGSKAVDSDKLDGQDSSYFAKASQVLTNVPAGAKFTDTNTWRSISDSVSKVSNSISASLTAVKAAYDRATQALNIANSKLGATAKAVDSDKVDGFHASQSAGAKSSVVVSDSSGYIKGTYFNSNRGDEASAAKSYIYDTGDGFMRKKTTANARNELVVASDVLAKLKGVDGSGSGLDADLLDGLQGSQYAKASQVLTNVPAGAKFTDTNTHRSISDSVGSTSTSVSASSKAVKTAYDKGVDARSRADSAYSLAAGKLAAGGKAVDSDKLDGLNSTDFARSYRDIKTPTSLGSSDLNSIQNTGFYYQSSNANTSAARHYPVNTAGTLIVTSAAGIVQTYIPYGSPNAIYTRGYYGSSWSGWARMYSTAAKPTAADVGLGSVPNWSSGTFDGRYLAKGAKAADSDKLDGQHGSYFAKASQVLTNVPKGAKFTDTNTHRAISDSVSSTSTTVSASSRAVKTAYDRGTQALNTANGKLGSGSKAVDSARLNGVSNSTGASANYIAQRDGAGDLHTRLFRTNYGNESRVTGAMAFRVNNSSDNYIRFCSSPAAIRAWLGVYDKNEVNAKDPKAWVLLRNGAQNWDYTSPVDLRGKEVFFLQTDQKGRDETSTAKSLIPHTSGFHADQRHYIYAGNCKIEYEYSTRKIYIYGELGNRQIWYRDPSPHDYPPIGIVKP